MVRRGDSGLGNERERPRVRVRILGTKRERVSHLARRETFPPGSPREPARFFSPLTVSARPHQHLRDPFAVFSFPPPPRTAASASSTLTSTSAAVGLALQSFSRQNGTRSFATRGYLLDAASGHAYLPLSTASARLPPVSPAVLSKGDRPPHAAANATHPSDHTSTRSSRSHVDGQSHNSGARKGAVHSAAAHSCAARASLRSRTATRAGRALPKSMSTARRPPSAAGSASRRTFPGLRSRCATGRRGARACTAVRGRSGE